MSPGVTCDMAVLYREDMLEYLYAICIRRFVTSDYQVFHVLRSYTNECQKDKITTEGLLGVLSNTGALRVFDMMILVYH